jgi:glutamate/tyrosine decarboxylase-like PLP-dependent enzyme
MAEIARKYGVWLHVDGAYGGFAALAESVAPLFAGLDQADSIALDPHKWLYGPMGCGCVLYRSAEAARAAFGQQAEYTRPIGLEHDEAFVFWDFGPELSRPFRALSLWLQFQVYGAHAIAAAIDSNIANARYLCELVKESEDFELLAPASLSVFCFRYAPRHYAGDLDALNERLLVELQRGGSSYLSNARVRGKFALRGCVLNYRTTPRDMEILLADVRAAAGAIVH